MLKRLMNIGIDDKIKGCIFGGAIGDSLGVPYENKSNILEINYDYPMYISDDTQLTLATCESVVNAKSIEPSSIAKTFVSWYKNKKINGVGASTFKAIQELSIGAHWASVGRKGEMAAGNGAAMRIAPLAFLLSEDNEENRILLRDICRITHHNEEAYVGALAVVFAIKELLSNDSSIYPSLIKNVCPKLPDSRIKDKLIEIQNLELNTSIKSFADKYGCSGYVVESIPLAIYSAEKMMRYGYREELENLILAGGDTDSNASIASQIAGTYLGWSRLPQDLFNKIYEKEIIEKITNQFIQFYESRI